MVLLVIYVTSSGSTASSVIIEKRPSRTLIVSILLPASAMPSTAATSVVHPEASAASPTPVTSETTSVAEASTALETSVLLELVSAPITHVLLGHSLVEMTTTWLVMERLLAVKVIGPTTGSSTTRATPVIKLLKLFLAAGTWHSVLVALMTYILFRFYLKCTSTYLAVFNTTLIITRSVLKVFPSTDTTLAL